MEKDIDRIQKNVETDIVIRVDDFGGRRGVTIREFVKSEKYQGFTKAGTRIPADKFKIFKAAINSIDEEELMEAPVGDVSVSQAPSVSSGSSVKTFADKKPAKKIVKKIDEIEEQEF